MAKEPAPTLEPSRGRSRERFEERRQEIVDIAAHLFAERGYHATSIGDLQEATQLQRGGLYHYIGSKEALLFMIHERFIEPLLAEAREIERRGDPPDVTLRALAEALMRDIAAYRDQVTVFLHEWGTVRDRDDERARKVIAARREFEAIVTRTLKRGMQEGQFRIEEPRLAMFGLLGMINYTYQWYRPGLSWSAVDVAEAFWSIYLDGIRVREEGDR